MSARVLVDTHIALWALTEPERLTAHERTLLTDEAVERWLSPMSVWEAAIKRESGRLQAPRALASVLVRGYDVLAVDAELLEAAAQLPPHHRDPFDRVLIAHARRERLAIVTRDAAFAAYDVALA